MAGVTYGTYSGTGPTAAWCGDYRDRDHLVPAPARVDAAAFTANAQGRKYIPSGTVVGRTLAERDAGAGYGPVATDAGGAVTDTDVYILAFDVTDANDNPDCELYRRGSAVKENFLPGFAGMSAGLLTWIRANYAAYRGVA